MTEGQRATVEFIKKYREERGIPPTIAEVARARNTSIGAAAQMMQRLVYKGYLERTDRGWRAVKAA